MSDFVSSFWHFISLTFCSCEKKFTVHRESDSFFLDNFVKNLAKEAKMQPARMFVQRLANMTGNYSSSLLLNVIKANEEFYFSCYVTYDRTWIVNSISHTAFLFSFAARRGYQTKHFRKVTMNDLPVPQGDFFELEAARNRKYNAILLGGIALAGGSLALACSTGLIELHMSPPKSVD